MDTNWTPMIALEKRVYYRLLAGLCIVLFPITMIALICIGISALLAVRWKSKHCITPEQFEQQLAAEGRIILIQQ